MTRSRPALLGALCALALPSLAVAEPTVPTPAFPLIGQTMDVGEETLRWVGSKSPEGLDLSYEVQVLTPTGVTEVASALVEGPEVEWLIDVALEVDTMYSWQVRAVDTDGNRGEFSERVLFGYLTENSPPSTPLFIAPENESDVYTTQPEFRMVNSVDPEDGLVIHTLEVDSAASFNTSDLLIFEPQSDADGEVSVDMKGTGDVLREDATWYARATAVDAEGISASPDSISFFVRGDNAPPPTPDLVRPLANEVTGAHPTLVVSTVTDPEGDVVTYEFAIGGTRDLSDVGAVSSGTREIEVTQDLVGGFYWTVRARDDGGARSDWAEPRYGVAADPAWGCTTSGGGVLSWRWLSLVLGLGLMRRRRLARCLTVFSSSSIV